MWPSLSVTLWWKMWRDGRYLAKTRKLNNFNGSIIEDMRSYFKLPFKRDPDCIIIHVGLNDFRSSQDPESIAKKT